MSKDYINGVEVCFPYRPYPIQRSYMNQVLTCCKEKKNGLLESPTGTGKTLSLLCASLAWLKEKRKNEKEKNGETNDDEESIEKANTDVDDFFDLKSKKISKMPQSWKSKGTRIVYASRTHVQLSQAIGEMKKTSYNDMYGVVLGSRDQMCLHPEVKRLDNIAAKNNACRVKTNHSQCPFYIGYYMENKVYTPDYVDTPVHDIEDLITLGKKHICCPYYSAKTLAERSDIVFMPYNYLIDPSIRKGVPLKDSVIIIDEGHNIESSLEESSSTELKSETLAVCVKHLTKMLEEMCENERFAEDIDEKTTKAISQLSIGDLAELKEILLNVELEVDKIISSVNSKQEIVDCPTNWIFDAMDRATLSDNVDKVMHTIDNLITVLIGCSAMAPALSTVISALDKFRGFVSTVYQKEAIDSLGFSQHRQNFQKFYKVFAVKELKVAKKNVVKAKDWIKRTGENDSETAWTLNTWCLTPSVGMQAMLRYNIHCCIITSGTLAPLMSFSAEMEVPFPVTLQNNHIINNDNLQVYIVGRGGDGTVLNSNYENRENIEYYRSLGEAVLEFSKFIPGGVFLFFSSYTVMNKCVSIWNNEFSYKIWNRLSSVKQLFIEPKSKSEFSEKLKAFMKKVDEEGSFGALFIGVCRGKLAEGLDLNDQYCRGVMVAGLPYASYKDRRVVLKRDYLKANKSELTPEKWYTLQMTRAVNQAIGRIIRHKDDYGVVILFDARFSYHINELSKWIKPLVLDKSYKDTFSFLSTFFRNKLKRIETTPQMNENHEQLGIKAKAADRSIPVVGSQIDDLFNEYLTPSLTANERNRSTNNAFDVLMKLKRPSSKMEVVTIDEELDTELNLFRDVIGGNQKKRKLNVPLVTLNVEDNGEKGSTSAEQTTQKKPSFDNLVQIGKEFKELFKGTNKFKRLCDTLKNYKNHQNVKALAQSCYWIFSDISCSKSVKEKYFSALSMAIPDPVEKAFFLKECNGSLESVSSV